MKKILLLQVREEDNLHGERERIARQTGRQPADFVYVNCLTDNLSAVNVSEYSHVIMGGSGLVNISDGELEWFTEGKRIVRDCAGFAVPFFGICFGMQFLAYTFGGKLEKDNVKREVGTIEVETFGTAGTLFNFLPTRFRANAVHSDFVTVVPDEFQVLGRSEKCAVQILAHREKALYGVQFHPEHNAESLRASLGVAAAKYGEKYFGNGALAGIMEEVVDNDPAVENILKKFLKLAKKVRG